MYFLSDCSSANFSRPFGSKDKTKRITIGGGAKTGFNIGSVVGLGLGARHLGKILTSPTGRAELRTVLGGGLRKNAGRLAAGSALGVYGAGLGIGAVGAGVGAGVNSVRKRFNNSKK